MEPELPPTPITKYPPVLKTAKPFKSGGQDGAYHNHHLLRVRGVLEGDGSARRSPSSPLHRRGHDHPVSGLCFLRREYREGALFSERVRLHQEDDFKESPQPQPPRHRCRPLASALRYAGRTLQGAQRLRGLTWWTPCQWPLATTSEFAAADSILWRRRAKAFVAISRANAAISTVCGYIWLSAARGSLWSCFGGWLGGRRGGVKGDGSGVARRLDHTCRQGLH